MPTRVITDIIIHCSATRQSQDIGYREIDRWHRAKGWLECGYHYIIRRSGTLELGRAEGMAGAHCMGQNPTSIGICLVGGTEADGKTPISNYTDEQWVALKELVQNILGRYPDADVKGHNDFTDGKTCPNFDVKSWWKKEKEVQD